MIVICDIDGTLADPGTFEKKKDFYRRDCRLDRPIIPVVHVLALVAPTVDEVVLMSGREEKHRARTEEWLGAHDIPYSRLHMRSTGDRRSDDIVKRELFEAHVGDQSKVLFVIDDRPRVVRVWRELGLFVFDVNQKGVEF